VRGIDVARPAVLFGGPSPEHDISILTGLQAARALQDAGLDPVGIYWSKAGDFHAVPATLEAKDYVAGVPAKAEPIDLVARPGGGFVGAGGRFGKRRELEVSAVVNCCHGGPGEDGSLQAALDLAGVRYTGPGAAGAALGMDKLAFGGAMTAAGLPTLPRTALAPDGGAPPFPGPYILKPRFGGSSIGIEITDDVATANALVRSSPHHRDGAVVEPYLPDSVDLNVSVRTWPSLQVSAVEKPIRKDIAGRIYTYADKYLGSGEGLSSAPRELPAEIADDVRDRIRHLAEQVATVALARGAPRIDFLWRGDDVWVNEINTIPGALAWYFWNAEGVSFRQLLLDLLDEAAKGPVRLRTTDGADGAALRAAGSIAGKLA
jgi:D-alanine-D-alanine ligase